jgi:GH35 family endo-1,4-beta-xylanase
MRSQSDTFRITRSFVYLIALLPTVAVSAPALAADPTELLTQKNWSLMRPTDQDLSLQASADGDLQISINRPSDPFWRLQVYQTIPTDIPLNHLLKLSFRARSTTHNPMRILIEHSVAPYTAPAEITQKLESDWHSYEIEGISPGFGPVGLAVKFQLGQQAGTIEISDIHLLDTGPDPASVDAAAAIEPAAIAARIDRYRKRMLQIHVTDATGHPVANARVEIDQTRQAFWFGCNLFGLDVHSTDALQQQYQQHFAALFNYATLPFYWGSYEKSQGQTSEPHLKEMALWCRDHHITAKGHPLIYAIVYPAWAPKNADSAIPLLHARVTDIIQKFDGLIDVFDVLNEANSATYYPNTGVGAWIARDGAPQVVGTALQWARDADPQHHDTFLYNDYLLTGSNIALLHWLADHNQLPDAIGIQSHMHGKNWPLTDIWITAQRFAQFHRPLHFTETTVVSGEHRPIPNAPGPNTTDWKTTPDGEKAQADYVVKFYSILFSHPSVHAITWWDFSDHNAWLGAPAGLVRDDMSPKPAYDALMQLIHHDWSTHADLITNISGDCTARAFCGDYAITIKDSAGHSIQREVHLPETADGTNPDLSVEVRLVP